MQNLCNIANLKVLIIKSTKLKIKINKCNKVPILQILLLRLLEDKKCTLGCSEIAVVQKHLHAIKTKKIAANTRACHTKNTTKENLKFYILS